MARGSLRGKSVRPMPCAKIRSPTSASPCVSSSGDHAAGRVPGRRERRGSAASPSSSTSPSARMRAGVTPGVGGGLPNRAGLNGAGAATQSASLRRDPHRQALGVPDVVLDDVVPVAVRVEHARAASPRAAPSVSRTQALAARRRIDDPGRAAVLVGDDVRVGGHRAEGPSADDHACEISGEANEEDARMRIAVGSDEAAPLTDALVAALRAAGHEVDAARAAGGRGRRSGSRPAPRRRARSRRARAERGVVCCWSGTGASIAANKVPGVRAALCADPETARMARRYNHANVLALSLRATEPPMGARSSRPSSTSPTAPTTSTSATWSGCGGWTRAGELAAGSGRRGSSRSSSGGRRAGP